MILEAVFGIILISLLIILNMFEENLVFKCTST